MLCEPPNGSSPTSPFTAAGSLAFTLQASLGASVCHAGGAGVELSLADERSPGVASLQPFTRQALNAPGSRGFGYARLLELSTAAREPTSA